MKNPEFKFNSLLLIVVALITSLLTAFFISWINTDSKFDQSGQIDVELLKSSLIEEINHRNSFEQSGKTKLDVSENQNALKDLQGQYAELKSKMKNIAQHANRDLSEELKDDNRRLSPEEEDALAQQRREESLLRMEDTLYSESVDENWSIQSEMAVMDSLVTVNDHLNIESVECGSTLCALHISGNESVGASEVMQSFSRNINWPGEMTMQYDITTGKGVAYLARDGFALPGAPQEGS